MALNRIPPLDFEIEGEFANLEQDCGLSQVDRVQLHVTHVRLLAQCMGLVQGDPDAWDRAERLERRILVLRDRLEALYSLLRTEGATARDGASVIHAESTLAIANEFCADSLVIDGFATNTRARAAKECAP
jgi:hypothetical protein